MAVHGIVGMEPVTGWHLTPRKADVAVRRIIGMEAVTGRHHGPEEG